MNPARASRWPRRLALAALAIVLLLATALLAGWLAMRASLPRLEGRTSLPGLSSPVNVERDERGVVTVSASDRLDAARALGYVHAQERYFEMDLMRRSAAGELSELVGAAALKADRRARVHRMRARLTAHLDEVMGEEKPLLQAYVDGVNAGLAALRARPWPYLLLRQKPAPWTAVDSALVAQAMYFDLQDGANSREYSLWRLRATLPPALFALLTHDGSRWDAPVSGQVRGDARLPGAHEVDLRKLPAGGAAVSARARPETGSNNFAVAGALTRDGRAIVADDMHLTLRAPNIWFRAQLRYADPRAPGGRVDIGGFTLPGLPLVIAGSNTYVAWGFTNSYGDYADWQLQPPCPSSRPAQCGVRTVVERIRVAGGPDVEFPVEETAWGPVLHRNPDGSRLALRWTAHLPGALNFGLAGFARAGSLDDALRIAAQVSIPHQNLVVGDRSGRIAWRLLGPLPGRDARCLSVHGQVDARDVAAPSCTPWPLSTDHPVAIVDPLAHRLWTANSRVVDGAPLARIGDGGYVLGARAKQIRDDLFARTRFTEADLLAIQLDDRPVFLRRWWTLLRERAAASRQPALSALAAASATWPAHTSTGSVSYRLVRAWRLAVHERIAEGLTAPARAAGVDFETPSFPQLEGVAWPLLEQRPAHLLPRRYASWDALMEDAAADVREELEALGPLRERTWGEHNTTAICHPLAAALPRPLKRLVCMPAEPLPGDTAMPRVQGPDFGASERMVVSPGHERDGIVHMPGGQSGHRLSPYWGAGHEDWARGRMTPFLPGPAQYVMELQPAK